MTHDPRAQSAVEALLGTILFVTLIFGGLELARAVSLKQALDRGAFEGVATWPPTATSPAQRPWCRRRSAARSWAPIRPRPA